jgi:DNA-binding MarR family transcriptional regulator
MKLEQEIQQKKSFHGPYHKLGVNITYTYYWIQERWKQILKPHGISLQQYNILRILRGQYPNPSRINLLKERMMDKSSDASRLVERLRGKGLVERVISAEDRRAVDTLITKKGLDLLEKIDAMEHQFEAILHTITPEEAEIVNDTLDKMRG